jgi:L-threonylcarbamoyladenylate synthase
MTSQRTVAAMSPTLDVADPGALDAAASALTSGLAIVLPTDTVYGVAVTPGNEQLLYALKGRPESMPIAVLVAGVEQAEAATGLRLPRAARRLAKEFWPGALTLVVPAAGEETLGVRCPAHPFPRGLAERCGPIATTSANRHGQPTPPTASAAAGALVAPGPALVVDGGPCEGVASTVLDLTGAEPRVLREGGVTADAIAAVLSPR